MNLIVLTPPPVEPVTLAEVYTHLRLDPSDDSPPTHPDDALLSSQIATARDEAEQMTRRALIEQTLRLTVARFPSCGGWIELPRPPFLGVQAVRYYDHANVLRSVDAADYFVTDDFVPRLMFADTFAWPQVYARADAVRIDYVAGYAPEGSPAEDYRANVPEQIRQAILLGVQLLYDSLSPEQRAALEQARRNLLVGYRVETV